MGVNAELIDLSPTVESPRKGQGVSCRFRCVLRDIGRHPQVTPVVDQILYVELNAPTNGLPAKPNQLEFGNDFEKLGVQKVNIDPRRRAGETGTGSINPKDEIGR